MEDSDSTVEADLISATAAWVAALTTFESLSTMQFMIPPMAASPMSLGAICTMRSATVHTASLAACDMPGKREICTRAPASMSRLGASSGLISWASSRQVHPSSAVHILSVFLGVPTPLVMSSAASSFWLASVLSDTAMLSRDLSRLGPALFLRLALASSVFGFAMQHWNASSEVCTICCVTLDVGLGGRFWWWGGLNMEGGPAQVVWQLGGCLDR